MDSGLDKYLAVVQTAAVLVAMSGLIVALTIADLGGPEIAQLQVHQDSFRDAAWAVWRPGEGTFAGRDWS